MDISHFIFHSSVDKLGLFHFLAIMHNSDKNLYMRVFVQTCVDTWFPFSQVYTYLEIKLVGHMVTLFLTFGRTSRLFSKVLQHFTFLSAEQKGSYFSTFSTAIRIFHSLDCYYLSRCKVVSYWDLDFHFPYPVISSIFSFVY